MSADIALRWLFENLLVEGMFAAAFASALVLLARRPLRRAFGARVAYGAWGLVPVALLAVLLPGPHADTLLSRVLPAFVPTVRVGTPMPLTVADSAAAWAADPMIWLMLVWLVGAGLLALHFWRQQRSFVRGLGRLRVRSDGLYAADAHEGPAVIGAWRPRVVLPIDFDTRYSTREGELVIAHERIHLLRGDVRANFIATGLRCMYWFNPLMHVAVARFRLDQELACDAAVLARHPDARRAYADAMLNTQLAVPGLPVGCHWQSSQSLKERILMLKQPQPSIWRRRGGLAVVVITLAASSYAAWALQPARDTHPTNAPSPPPPPLPPPPVPPPPPPPPPPAPKSAVAIPAPAAGTRALGGMANIAIGAQHEPLRQVAARPATHVPAGHRDRAAQVDIQSKTMAPPRYPADAAAGRITGEVIVIVSVAADGSVADARVETSKPAGVFDQVTLDAVKNWKFEPAIEHGRPVAGRVRVPVTFAMDPDKPTPAPEVAGKAV